MNANAAVHMLLAMNDQLTKTLIQVLGALALQIITARAAASKAADKVVDETTGVKANSNGFKGGNRMNYESHDEGMSSFVPGLLIGGIIGALIGAAAALWFAPQSGEQTQEQIRQEAIRLKQSANEALGEVKSNLDSTAGQVKDKAESALHEGQQFVHQQAEKVSHGASNLQNKVSTR
jgi:gas vesicle protein